MDTALPGDWRRARVEAFLERQPNIALGGREGDLTWYRVIR